MVPKRKPQSEISRRVRDAVKDAFLAVRNGYSPDRVVADPALDIRFLEKCKSLGTALPAGTLNQLLLNLRKAGQLRGLHSKHTTFSNQADYIFASEIAVRFLERRDGITLDEVICHPALAEELDKLAAEVAPGYTSLQYRWAALSLRKNRRLSPEPLSHVVEVVCANRVSINTLQPEHIPTSQGLYLFHSQTECLYIGEASNLRNRLKKHLVHSDNKHLARWFWENEGRIAHLEWQVLPVHTSTRIRRAMECELIRSRKPVFNVVYTQST